MATKVNESRHLEKRVSKEAIEESGRIEAEIESIKRSLLKLRARECPDWRLGSREGDFSRDSTGSHRCDASSGRLYSKLDEEIKRLTLTDSRFEVLYANSKPISRIPHEETPRQQHISLSLSNDSSTIATSSIKSISKQQSLFRPKPVLLSLPSIVPRGNLFNTLNPGHPSPVNPKIRLVSNLKPHIRSTSLHKKTVTFRKAPALPRVATLQDPGLLFQMDSLATESKNEELLARVLRELNEEESLQVGLARKLLSCEAEINENRSHSKACDMLLETTIAKYSESSHYSNAQGRKSSTGNLGKKTSSKKLKQVQLEQNKYLRAEADRKIKQIKETKQAAERQIEVGVYLKDSLKKDLELSRFKATLLAKRLDEVQKTLVKYYLEILREGKDTRTEGLPWLVKAIWRLKSSVLISSMPSFLDTRLIYYIFAFSHRSVELDKAKALLNEARSRVKTYRGRKIRGKSKKIRFDKSEVSH